MGAAHTVDKKNIGSIAREERCDVGRVQNGLISSGVHHEPQTNNTSVSGPREFRSSHTSTLPAHRNNTLPYEPGGAVGSSFRGGSALCA